MKYVIYFLYVFSIKLLLADLEIAIVHLHDVHDNLTFDDNFTDNQGLENETDYFIDHLPKLVRFINWIRNENKQRRVHTIVLNTASFTGTKWSSKARKESIKLMNQLDIDCSVSLREFSRFYPCIYQFFSRLEHMVLISIIYTTVRHSFRS